MSRSFRKVGISTYAAVKRGQSKLWKSAVNRTFRRKAKVNLDTSVDLDGSIIKDYVYRNRNKRNYADIYDSPGDGRHTPQFMDYSEWVNNKRFGSYFYAGRFDTYDEYVIQYKKDFVNK